MGKSADIIPKTAIDYLLGHYPARVVITGASWQSLVKTVVPNLRRCVNELRIKCPTIFRAMGAYEWLPLGKDYDLSLEIVSTLAPERIQGRHCANTLVIVDEASGLAPEIAIAIDSFTQSPTSRQVYSGNPLCDAGPFFDSHHRNKGQPWHCEILTAMDSPNVIAGKQVVQGMATPEFVAAKRREWGEGSPEYDARVLARFPAEGSLTVISRSMIESAANRAVGARSGPLIMGLDIARSPKGDWTVWIARDAGGVRHWDHARGLSRDEVEGRTKAHIRDWGVDKVYCDDGGLVDLSTSLRNAGLRNVKGVMSGSSPHNGERYANCRAEMYDQLRGALIGGLAVPADLGKLLADEAGIQRTYNRAGKMLLESKDEFKARIGRSPDHQDALALTCMEAPGEASFPMVSEAHRISEEPMVFYDQPARRWAMQPEGKDLFRQYGVLCRSVFWSHALGGYCVWIHFADSGLWTVFDAVSVPTGGTVQRLASAVWGRSQGGKNPVVAHGYEMDLFTCPAESGDVRVYDAFSAYRDELRLAGEQWRGIAPTPTLILPELLAEIAGMDRIERLLLGTLMHFPGDGYWRGRESQLLALRGEAAGRYDMLKVWPGAVLEDLGRSMTLTRVVGDKTRESLGEGGGPFTVCLRALAVTTASMPRLRARGEAFPMAERERGRG